MQDYIIEWLRSKVKSPDTSVEQKGGVYAIVCPVTRRAYIGATRSTFATRFGHHIRQLESGRHHNRKLQYDYDGLKAVDGAFWLLVLEISDDPFEAEREYIKFFRKHGLAYNTDVPERSRIKAAERKRRNKG